jgi:hypothetical protein
VESQIKAAVDGGAKVLMGGRRMQRPGYFLEPTILTEIDSNNPVYYQELFAPVALIFRVKNEDEAIKLANDRTGMRIWKRPESIFRAWATPARCLTNRPRPRIDAGCPSSAGAIGNQMGTETQHRKAVETAVANLSNRFAATQH